MTRAATGFHVFAARRYPWAAGAMPKDARTAAAWIAAGWEPTEAQIRALGPARAAALGLEWVKVTAWPPWLMALTMAIWLMWFATTRGGRRRGSLR